MTDPTYSEDDLKAAQRIAPLDPGAWEMLARARAEGRREAEEEHKTLYAALRLDLSHAIEKRQEADEKKLDQALAAGDRKQIQLQDREKVLIDRIEDLQREAVAAEARLREIEEQQSCHDCKEYREHMTAKLREVERERDEALASCDRYRLAPFGGGFRFQWQERAEAAEAKVQELEDWKDAHTMLLAGQGLRLRELRAALRGLVAKLGEITRDERYRRVWEVAYIHGVPYTGPNWVKEVIAAEALLARTAEGVD